MNTPHHFYRQAANCARCGTFVKGVDSIKNKKQSTLALPLTKVLQRAYLWLGGEMVIYFDDRLLDQRMIGINFIL